VNILCCKINTGCLKIARIPNSERGREGPSGARKIPIKKTTEFFSRILRKRTSRVHLQTNISLWGESRFFFYFHIWTTEVIPYNTLNLEFANFSTPCMLGCKINIVSSTVFRLD
jgi:hypothetical protein